MKVGDEETFEGWMVAFQSRFEADCVKILKIKSKNSNSSLIGTCFRFFELAKLSDKTQLRNVFVFLDLVSSTSLYKTNFLLVT